MGFTKEDLTALEAKLRSLSKGEAYIAFEKKCVPGVEHFLGVNSPNLRKIAKELLKGDWRGFLQAHDHGVYEFNVLSAMVIAGAQCELGERLDLIRDFVPHIDNWGVCDVLCADMKCAGRHRTEFWAFLAAYLASEEEYALRFGVVMLLCHFLVDEYIDRVLPILCDIRHDGYYVKMAIAWALSYCCIKYWGRTVPLIESGAIEDRFTHNKTIQKSIESFRIDDERKAYLRSLRRK